MESLDRIERDASAVLGIGIALIACAALLATPIFHAIRPLFVGAY